MIFSLRVIAMLAVCAASMFSQRAMPNPTPPRSVTEVFDRSVRGPEYALFALAEKMPANHYGFVPTKGEFKGVRTFAQLAKHIAVDNYLNGAALLGEKSPVERGLYENGSDSIRGKTEVMKFLRESFAYLHQAMATVNESNLMETVEFQRVKVPRLSIVTAAISHPWDIYGQMIEYARMNGIDPQKRPRIIR